jgi:hypothetical protein
MGEKGVRRMNRKEPQPRPKNIKPLPPSPAPPPPYPYRRETSAKEQRMGIKNEATGKYFTYGENLSELAVDIKEKANAFHVLYEYDHDVEKMVKLANEIREKAENMALITEKIAESIDMGE